MAKIDTDRKAGDDAGQRVSFYFAAHEDDWQLFMNPSAFRDVLDGIKSVFIHVTAGDAGLGTKSAGRKYPRYRARENGAESAIRFMADSDDRAPVEAVASVMVFKGHPIRHVSYRNTVAYFLRLPDGSPSGAGYSDTGYQSLKRLAEGQIETLTAIDDTTAYQSWRDLVATLRAIIDFERGPARSVQVHIPELDPSLNPNDHSDHVMTAKTALDAAGDLSDARWLHHLGYASGARPENLSGHDRDMKCAVYAVTLAGVMAFDHPTSWQQDDQIFVARNYCRVENRAKRTGPT